MAGDVCLIPARGGSKRIPGKNIRPFAGRPMIDWSIAAALDAGCFDRVIVSTDDEAIAETARTAGAEVPFVRPDVLADDHATTAAVIAHALDWLEGRGGLPRALCCLYATAPFVRAGDLLAARAMLDDGSDFAMPVAAYAFPVQRAVFLDGGHMRMADPGAFSTRSQDLPEAYHDAGQFYWGTVAAWRSGAPVFGPRTAALVLPRWRVQDIDTPEDWHMAERLFALDPPRGDG